MASEAVKKILAAEAESEKKNAEARKKRDENIAEAQGNSALAIQKRLTEAAAQSAASKKKYAEKLKQYRLKAEEECSQKLNEIENMAQKNMDDAADAVIAEFF